MMKFAKNFFFLLFVLSIFNLSCSSEDPIEDTDNGNSDVGETPEPEPEERSLINVENLSELSNAISSAKAGDSIVVKGGTYTINTKLRLMRSGTSEELIYLVGDNSEERPYFDFSGMSENSSNQGMLLTGNYWHIKGIDVFGAGDNGMKIEGSNNLIEFCTFSECADTGLQLDSGASDNIILNCDSYFNADSSIENADGFAAKLTVGSGNSFVGCRAWNNLDDGWDGYLRGSDNITTTHENCWAIRNGYMKNGSIGGGDGNGFKTGGSDDKTLKHNALYVNCIAVGNVYDGFDHNSNRGTVEIYNSVAYNNGTNYHFTTTNPLAELVIKNSLALGEKGKTDATVTDISHNSWQLNVDVTEDDFRSLDVDQLLQPRKADGSLPDVDFMHLVSGSDLIDKGVDVGLPYNGSAPDLGAFEFGIE